MADILDKAHRLRRAKRELAEAQNAKKALGEQFDAASSAIPDLQAAVEVAKEELVEAAEAEPEVEPTVTVQAATAAELAIDSINQEAEEAGHAVGSFQGEPETPSVAVEAPSENAGIPGETSEVEGEQDGSAEDAEGSAETVAADFVQGRRFQEGDVIASGLSDGEVIDATDEVTKEDAEAEGVIERSEARLAETANARDGGGFWR